MHLIDIDDHDALPGGQTRASLRARVLLGLLADEEAARLVLVPTRAQLDETTRWFRAQHDMHRRVDVEDFLAFAGLELAELSAQMRTFCTITAVGAARDVDVAALLPRYRGLTRAREWHHQRPVGG